MFSRLQNKVTSAQESSYMKRIH